MARRNPFLLRLRSVKMWMLRYHAVLELYFNHTRVSLEEMYMNNPPEGMTSEDILCMSVDDLLNMDYFLNEYDLLDDGAGVEGFYIF